MFRYGLLIAAAILPFLVSVSALLPDVLEYRARTGRIDSVEVERWWQASQTEEENLQRLNSVRLGILGAVTGADSLTAAENLIGGVLDVTGLPRSQVSIPLSAADLTQGPPALQLNMASLLVADIFLEAYVHSGDERYLDYSIYVTEGFLEYEKSLWFPVEYIWNDHAIAARTLFLTRLVGAVMNHSSERLPTVISIFEGIDRSVRRLAKPTQFTFRTNHGVIQNLAILHVAAFNAGLPSVTDVLDDVIFRLEEQILFFVSEGGVVPEHSAGYQVFGVQLLRQAIDYLGMLNRDVPESWASRLTAAEEFTANLVRPDGTLPRYGDTSGIEAATSQWQPPSTFWLSEDMGYWNSRFTDNSHLFVPWANLPGAAHKHADEMSVIFWQNGVEWWTGTGYWPYGHPGQLASFEWLGSNAPHGSDETSAADRQSRIINWMSGEEYRFLHLKRNGPADYQVDRIILEDKSGFWFVMDSTAGSRTDKTIASWTTMNSVSVEDLGEPGIFRLSDPSFDTELRVNVMTGAGGTYRWEEGRADADIGRIVLDGQTVSTKSLVVETSGGSWALLAWAESSDGSPAAFVENFDWSGVSHWNLRYTVGGETREVRYDQDSLTSRILGQEPQTMPLTPGKQALPGLQESRRRYDDLQQKFSRYRDLLPYRMRAFYALFGAAVLQVLLVLTYLGRFRRVPPAGVTILFGVLWLGLGVWMHTVYFVV